MTGQRPRLGFLGVGWIGQDRLRALVRAEVAEVVAIVDPSARRLKAALDLAPGAEPLPTYDDLLEARIDGVVIATPSALHAEQAVAALERGLSVFCQKPLGRSAEEVASVIKAARAADRLLGVDLSYRFTEAFQALEELVDEGALGSLRAMDLFFHNAYGPDQGWAHDRTLSGGGCVIDLGIHLVDVARCFSGGLEVRQVTSQLYAGERRLPPGALEIEDLAFAQIDFEGGATARLACSWNLSSGREADIRFELHGTRTGALFSNVEGSFYDFVAERFEGAERFVLAEPPDRWGGRALVDWARRLAQGERFDPSGSEDLLEVARLIDAIYRGRWSPAAERRTPGGNGLTRGLSRFDELRRPDPVVPSPGGGDR